MDTGSTEGLYGADSSDAELEVNSRLGYGSERTKSQGRSWLEWGQRRQAPGSLWVHLASLLRLLRLNQGMLNRVTEDETLT